jgi:hypothetical protein
MRQRVILVLGGACLLLPALALAVSKELPYPEKQGLSAEDISAQVYFVNHFYGFENYGIGKEGDLSTIVIKRQADGKLTTNTVERYLNNAYDDGKINAKDLAIFGSGHLRGTGLLITEYVDVEKSQLYSIWLPTLRRIRKFPEPAHDDAWSGSDFTFGDVYLRRPYHENHTLLGTETLQDCLRIMEIPESERTKHMSALPEPACEPKGRDVYKIKSTTKFDDWWYDYRISYIDTENFADYRTDYYKDGEYVKFIERYWYKPENSGPDPRALSWGYWYGKNMKSGHESWAVIPKAVVKFNDASRPPSFWSENTLRKLRR